MARETKNSLPPLLYWKVRKQFLKKITSSNYSVTAPGGSGGLGGPGGTGLSGRSSDPSAVAVIEASI